MNANLSPQMPMMSPMNMAPSMPVAMMMPMSCRMTCTMTDKGMQCMMMPAEGMSMDMMKDMCMTMMSMMKNGTPCMMMCAGMPMMSCCGMAMNPMMSCEMTAKGMQFIEVDRGAFRQALAKTSFYADWKAKFGEEAWAQLEKAAGKLS